MSTMPVAPDDIAHVIQVALAPAFLLTALATLLNVFSTRLGRVADKVDAAAAGLRTADADEAVRLSRQLSYLRRRSFVLDVAVGDVVATARTAGLQVFGADGGGAVTIEDLALSRELIRPTAWVMGNEAWGLPEGHADLLDRLVALPIYGRAESLNLSTAAAVFLYASASAQRAGR